jgi:hypothetical protein
MFDFTNKFHDYGTTSHNATMVVPWLQLWVPLDG